MKPFIIRTASISDAEAIAECHKVAVEKRAAGFYDENIISEWSWGVDRMEKILGRIQNPDFICVVASVDDYILGYGMANPRTFEFTSLSTRPNNVGRIGAAILAELLEQCKKQGCPYLELLSSLNAEKFYLDNGFRILKKDQYISSSGLAMDSVKMRIDLL